MLFMCKFAWAIHNFNKDSFISVLTKGYKVYHYVPSCDDCSIRVYQSFTTIFHLSILTIVSNIYFTLPYYAGIIFNVFKVTRYTQNYVGIRYSSDVISVTFAREQFSYSESYTSVAYRAWLSARNHRYYKARSAAPYSIYEGTHVRLLEMIFGSSFWHMYSYAC